jgi:hypothetical protein
VIYAVFDANAAVTYNIIVDITGTGNVTVTGAGGYSQTVSVTSIVAVPVTAGYSLTFTAAATGTNAFVSFTLNSGTANFTSPQTYTVANTDVIYAVFSGSTNAVTVNITGNGTVELYNGATLLGTASGSSSTFYILTSVASVTFIPVNGTDVFEKFTVGSVADYTPGMTRSVAGGLTVNASFVSSSSVNTVTVTITGNGTVELYNGATLLGTASGPSTVFNLPMSITSVRFAAVNGTDLFEKFNLSTAGADSYVNPTVYGVINGMTVDASFIGSLAGIYDQITVTVIGSGSVDIWNGAMHLGTVTTPSAVVNVPAAAVSADLTAVPAAGSNFSVWQGDASGNNPQFSLAMGASRNVTAVFASAVPPTVNYYITATSDGMSSVSPEGRITAAGGSNMTFYFSADPGRSIRTVVVDGRNLSQAEIDLGYYTFANVSSSHTISVYAENGPRSPVLVVIDIMEGKGQAQYSINGGAFRTYTGPVTAVWGDDITVRASPAGGYKFAEWKDGSTVITTSEYAMRNVSVAVKDIELYFEESDSSNSLLWWIAAAVILLAAAGTLFWFLFFYRRMYDVIKVTHSLAIIGKDRVRRKAAYTFTIEGAQAGTVSYRVGEDGQWKAISSGADGEYVIPKGEITDAVTIEYR